MKVGTIGQWVPQNDRPGACGNTYDYSTASLDARRKSESAVP